MQANANYGTNVLDTDEGYECVNGQLVAWAPIIEVGLFIHSYQPHLCLSAHKRSPLAGTKVHSPLENEMPALQHDHRRQLLGETSPLTSSR
jgi:hypothetical protein